MAAIDVIRRAWALWEQRDMEATTELMDPDVVHDLSHYPGFPGEPVNQGIGPAYAALAEWMGWWRAYRQELLSMEEHGDRVLVVVHQVGIQDGERREADLGLLFFVGPEGRITRWEPWADLDAARAALRGESVGST